MEILIVRHGIAGARDAARWPDDRERPLTAGGARKFGRVASRLRRLFPKVERIWSSPLIRAWETAELLSGGNGGPAPEALAALEPGSAPEAALAVLGKQRGVQRAALVGHEPHLHELISHMVGGAPTRIQVEMKKGGAACVRFAGPVRAGQGELCWLAPPKIILGKRSRK